MSGLLGATPSSFVSIRLCYWRVEPTEATIIGVLLFGSVIFEKGAFDTSRFLVSHLIVLSAF
jgi:hypothetical protein